MKKNKLRNRKPRRNPYLPLHKKLVEFATTSELDPELVARNEYLRLENMILRSMFLEKKKRLRFTEEEKQELARAAAKVKGRSKKAASMLTPWQVLNYSRHEAGKKYVSVFPRKPPRVRLSKAYKEDILRSIVVDHPSWKKSQIWKEMEKYFNGIPAFQVYNMLYDMGYWDAEKTVKGIPWNDFLKRFEKVTWAGDFFSTEVWTDHGQWTFYTLFFIHLETQKVIIAGTTNHCTSQWLVNTLKWWTGAGESPFGPDARFLIRDRDRRYTAEVDWYFMEMGMMPKVISPGAPVMNYHAEQFVRKIKHECLSHCLFLSGTALRKVIDAYVDYYNTQRPNSRFNGGCILEDHTHWQTEGEVKQVSLLPGLLNYYFRERTK